MSSLARSLEKHLKSWLPELVEESNIEVDKVTIITNGILNKARNMKPRKLPPGPSGTVSLCAGARRYNIPDRTVSGWYHKGLLSLVTQIGNRKYFYDNDIKLLAGKYRPGRGYRDIYRNP